MKKKLIFLTILFLGLILLILTLSASATIYRIKDIEGNTIRVTTEPQMKVSEEEAGCTLNPLQIGSTPAITQDDSRFKGIVFDDNNANGKMDEGEKGIANVSVSNGLTITVTDKIGYYLLPREGHFIFLTIPHDYTPTTCWYKDLSENNHYFGLKYTPEKNTVQFTFVQITDHHTDSIGEHQKIIEKAIEEINQINPDFIVATGDLILKGDEVSIEQAQEWFDIYTNLINKIKSPIFHTLGNHDVVGINYKKDLSDKPGYNKEMYRHYFGPTYYSFDWGLYHCIILDPNELLSSREFYKIPDYQIKWLKEDLAYYKRYPLLVFFHEPSKIWQNQSEVLNLFKQNPTKMFSGHWHIDILLDSQGIPEQVTGAVCGEWWLGNCPDGKPNGYRIVQIKGENISSFYKEIGKDKQINIISPEPLINKSEETLIYAKIYQTGDEQLQKVNYQIDDSKAIPMRIERGELWDIATSSMHGSQLTEGYHTITVEAQDKEGVFSREIKVKVWLTQDNLLPLGELISNFTTYQGHIIKVKGKIYRSFMEEPFVSKKDGVLLIKDETGKAGILIADDYILTDTEIEKDNSITAEVIPIRYSWKILSKGYKLLIALNYFRLPRGFIEKKFLKPKGIYLLWLFKTY